MKNLTNAKIILVMMIMIAVMLISTSVFAEDSSGWADLTNTLSNTSPSPAAATGNVVTPTATNTNTGVSTNTTTNLTPSSNTSSNSTQNTTNVTSYNSTNTSNLPETGLQDSLPLAGLIVVVAISAVYAFKKVKDYQNL